MGSGTAAGFAKSIMQKVGTVDTNSNTNLVALDKVTPLAID
jgi:hypothetical protein